MHRVLFELGPIKIYSYGAMLVLAFLAGIGLARSRARRYGLTPDQISDAAFWALILGILGARILYILLNLSKYTDDPSRLLTLQFDGLTSFGGIVGGILGLWIGARRAGQPLLNYLDTAGAAFLLAHPIGRVGCLLNGCCHGRLCESEWYCVGSVEGLGKLFFPAQLIDSALNLVALALLVLVIERRFRLRRGQSFAIAIGMHGVARFIYEFWRAGTREENLQGLASAKIIEGIGLTEAQLAAMALVVLSVALVFWYRRRDPIEGAPA